MLRSAKRKVGGVQSGGEGVSSSPASKKNKILESGISNVKDIEEVPDFVHHKDSFHCFSPEDIEGLRRNLLEVPHTLLYVLSSKTTKSNLIVSVVRRKQARSSLEEPLFL